MLFLCRSYFHPLTLKVDAIITLYKAWEHSDQLRVSYLVKYRECVYIIIQPVPSPLSTLCTVDLPAFLILDWANGMANIIMLGPWNVNRYDVSRSPKCASWVKVASCILGICHEKTCSRWMLPFILGHKIKYAWQDPYPRELLILRAPAYIVWAWVKPGTCSLQTAWATDLPTWEQGNQWLFCAFWFGGTLYPGSKSLFPPILNFLAEI